MFSSSASIGVSQLVTMITNVFFGPIVNSARAIAFQVSSAMNSFTGNIIMAVRPPMIKQYAEGDYFKVNRYFTFSSKAVFYSLLLILLPFLLVSGDKDTNILYNLQTLLLKNDQNQNWRVWRSRLLC